MNFNSFEFLVFLAIVLVLYFVLPHKIRWVMLLIASYYFYMSWNASLVFLIFGTTFISYLSAILMEKTEKKSIKTMWLVLTLVVCLGVLAFFKYANFLIGSVIDFLNLFKMNLSGVALNIILPVGISFYTFQTLSYVIDVYRGEYKAEKHFGYYALFVSYFPQLVAGPIERCDNLLPQLKVEHKLNAEDMSTGLRIALCGFFFKCVVADYLAVYVNTAFANLETANTLSILMAGLMFNVQIYCDFAGYSEIARGVARMMGVHLMRNFNKPFHASTYSELNRRWHISLNQWFTDYVYIPLGGAKKGTFRKCLNVIIVFALSGLWHGARWTYVLWGLYAAFFVVLEIVLYKPERALLKKLKIDAKSKGYRTFRCALMWPIFIGAGLIFRSQSLSDIITIFTKLFTGFGFGDSYFAAALSNLGMNVLGLITVVILYIAMEWMEDFANYEPSKKKEQVVVQKPLSLTYIDTKWVLNDGKRELTPEEKLLYKQRQKSIYAQKVAVYGYALFAITLCWLALIMNSDSSAFAYFQF